MEIGILYQSVLVASSFVSTIGNASNEIKITPEIFLLIPSITSNLNFLKKKKKKKKRRGIHSFALDVLNFFKALPCGGPEFVGSFLPFFTPPSPYEFFFFHSTFLSII